MKIFKKLTKYKKMWRTLILLFTCLIISNCVEEFEIETENFESILVVNTTVTNEVKHQQILLSRTFKFENEGPIVEQGATIKVIEEGNTEYLFKEKTPGTYSSVQKFGAGLGKGYQLSIKTSDGRFYTSDKMTLPQETVIGKVYPKRVFNDKGIEGIGIFIDTFDPTANSRYYRYSYDETYKIVAPFWIGTDLEPVFGDDGRISFNSVARSEEKKICYNSTTSNSIRVTNTTNFEEDRLTGFLVRFIRPDDIKVANRYSILVQQFVQSREANAFYEVLNNFSESESLFSQIQPGFISGNITSETNPDEKVLGFFDVSSVSTKRIFFDRDDLIKDLPDYYECTRIAPVPPPGGDILPIMASLAVSENVKFLGVANAEEKERGAMFVFVSRECGDCTALGKNKVPDFWVD